MRTLLLASLAAALAAIPSVPAQAESLTAEGFNDHRGFDRHHGDRDHRDHRRRDRRSDDAAVIVDFGYGGDWAYANNRTFEPNSYNDWWHDRPDRAYPRWMQNNRGCERQWWGGGAWRC